MLLASCGESSGRAALSEAGAERDVVDGAASDGGAPSPADAGAEPSRPDATAPRDADAPSDAAAASGPSPRRLYALTDRPPPDAAVDDPHGSFRWWSYEGDGSLGERGAIPVERGASAAVLSADEARLYVLGLEAVTFAQRGSGAGAFAERDRAVLAPSGVSSILLHPAGSFLVVAHQPTLYDDPPRRELELLPLGADGRFAGAPQVVASSTNHARLRWSPDRRFAIGMSCDQTSLSWYPVDAQARTLGPATLGIADTGGNDLAFHPLGDRAFVAGPGGLITLRYDAASGAVLRTGFTSYFRAGEDYGESCPYAHVAVHPSGRFVYALVANSLRTFSIEGESLVLRDVLEYTLFRAPSALVIAPGGERLFVANGANVVNGFRLDPMSGIPTFESNAPGSDAAREFGDVAPP